MDLLVTAGQQSRRALTCPGRLRLHPLVHFLVQYSSLTGIMSFEQCGMALFQLLRAWQENPGTTDLGQLRQHRFSFVILQGWPLLEMIFISPT